MLPSFAAFTSRDLQQTAYKRYYTAVLLTLQVCCCAAVQLSHPQQHLALSLQLPAAAHDKTAADGASDDITPTAGQHPTYYYKLDMHCLALHEVVSADLKRTYTGYKKHKQ
jgi:hypothetical protein